jgi:hypothetical protein
LQRKGTMKSLVRVLFLTLLFQGCKEVPGPIGPTGPSGALPNGQVAGRVLLVDHTSTSEDMIPFLRFHDSVKVTIQPSSALPTISDSGGRWVLKSVSPGIYTIIFSKPGFFQYRLYSQQYVGGDTLHLSQVFLSKIPPNSVSQFAITGPDSLSRFHVEGRVTSPDPGRIILVLLSARPINTSDRIESFTYNFWYISNSDSVSLTGGDLTVNPNLYPILGLFPGMPIYACAIPIANSWGSMPHYAANPATGQFEIENTGFILSPVDTIFLP